MVYWFYQMFISTIGKANPTIYFVFHFLIIFGTSIYIYKIVKYLSKSQFAGFLAGSFYILAPVNTENIYRLGPVEPILALFIAASLYYLLEKRAVRSILFLLLATFTKEAGFVTWLPVGAVYIYRRIIDKKRDLNFERYSLWGLAFLVPVLLNTLLRRSGYSSNYVFNLGQIISNFTGYIKLTADGFPFLFWVLLLSYLIRLAVYYRKHELARRELGVLYQAAFLALFFVFVVVISPWDHFLLRYLMPSTVGLVIFMGLEIAAVRSILEEYKFQKIKILAVIFSFYLILFFSGSMVRTYIYGLRYARETIFVQSVFKDLAENVPKDGLVLFNFPDIETNREYVVEAAMQFGWFYHRPDIRVDYLNLNKLPKRNFTIVGVTIVNSTYSREDIEKIIHVYRVEESVPQKKVYLVLTTPTNMIKQTVRKLYQLVIDKTPFSGTGIFTYYVSNDYWYRYFVSK